MGLTKPFAFMGSGDGPGIGYGNPPYNQSLIAYYDFGSNTEGSWTGSVSMSNGDLVTDLSGNEKHSTLFESAEQFTYEAGVGKGVISTQTKQGGYFFMPDLTGSFGALTDVTWEFVLNIPTALSADNLIFRFDGGGGSRAESNLQQYGGTPVPDRIGFDLRTEQNNSVNVGTVDQSVGTGFLHLVYTAGQGETTKTYYQGSELGASGGTMAATDTFDFDRNGPQTNCNSWFGTSNFGTGTFPAQIGVFRMYSAAMPAASVLANYNFYQPQF